MPIAEYSTHWRRLCARTELDPMLGECDIVVRSCALTPETTGLIDLRHLATIKPSDDHQARLLLVHHSYTLRATLR
jgi:phosphoglycerate dehydrogenase-like enzyme